MKVAGMAMTPLWLSSVLQHRMVITLKSFRFPKTFSIPCRNSQVSRSNSAGMRRLDFGGSLRDPELIRGSSPPKTPGSGPQSASRAGREPARPAGEDRSGGRARRSRPSGALAGGVTIKVTAWRSMGVRGTTGAMVPLHACLLCPVRVGGV